MNWTLAREYCRRKGGDLVRIDHEDLAKRDFLKSKNAIRTVLDSVENCVFFYLLL